MSRVRFRDDVDGCGCIRCQDVEHDLLQRSLPEVLVWSGRLPVVRPSVGVVFLAVGTAQLLLLALPGVWVLLGAVVGVFGVFVGRGYASVVGRAVLGRQQLPPFEALRIVGRGLPAFAGALLVISGLVSATVVVVDRVLVAPAQTAFRAVGVPPLAVELLSLLLLVGGVLYALIKFWFVPEACFVGGYGPLESLRVSWRITTLHRTKAVAIVGGFVVLLGAGILLDTHLADPGSPVVFSFSYRETTVVLRSFGFSAASGLRFLFDLLATTVYSGVFVHQYVYGVLER